MLHSCCQDIPEAFLLHKTAIIMLFQKRNTVRSLILQGIGLLVFTVAAMAESKDTASIIPPEIADACNGKEGSIDPSAVIGRDLTGDGNTDRIVCHAGEYPQHGRLLTA